MRNKLLLALLEVSLLDMLAAALAGAALVVKMTVGHKYGTRSLRLRKRSNIALSGIKHQVIADSPAGRLAGLSGS